MRCKNIIILILLLLSCRLHAQTPTADTTYRSSVFGKKIKAVNFFSNTILDSTYTFFKKKNRIHEKHYFKNSQLHGTIVAYYPSGQQKSRIEFNDGQRNGAFIQYQDDIFNSVLRIGFYKNNVLSDSTITYFVKDSATQEKQKIAIINYYNDLGQLNGIQYYYTIRGELEYMELYVNGEYAGVKSFKINGMLDGVMPKQKFLDHPFFKIDEEDDEDDNDKGKKSK